MMKTYRLLFVVSIFIFLVLPFHIQCEVIDVSHHSSDASMSEMLQGLDHLGISGKDIKVPMLEESHASRDALTTDAQIPVHDGLQKSFNKKGKSPTTGSQGGGITDLSSTSSTDSDLIVDETDRFLFSDFYRMFGTPDEVHDGDRLEESAIHSTALNDTKFETLVEVRSEGLANILHNERAIGMVPAGRKRTYKFDTQLHDIIGVIAHGDARKYGVRVIVTIGFQAGAQRYATGKAKSAFKVLSAKRAGKMDLAFWRKPWLRACHWEVPKELDGGLVWAPTAPERKEELALVRFKVGGEQCNPTKPRPSPGPNRCACRKVQGTGSDGACYEFTNSRADRKFGKQGRCEPRKCGDKFECVESGGTPDSLCVRRYATSEVRRIDRSDGVNMCTKVRLRPAKPFYVLYEF